MDCENHEIHYNNISERYTNWIGAWFLSHPSMTNGGISTSEDLQSSIHRRPKSKLRSMGTKKIRIEYHRQITAVNCFKERMKSITKIVLIMKPGVFEKQKRGRN